jgi:hypothetical protein
MDLQSDITLFNSDSRLGVKASDQGRDDVVYMLLVVIAIVGCKSSRNALVDIGRTADDTTMPSPIRTRESTEQSYVVYLESPNTFVQSIPRFHRSKRRDQTRARERAIAAWSS